MYSINYRETRFSYVHVFRTTGFTAYYLIIILSTFLNQGKHLPSLISSFVLRTSLNEQIKVFPRMRNYLSIVIDS